MTPPIADGSDASRSQPAFVQARLDDLFEVVGVLDDAAERLHGLGIRQWPRRFDPETVRPAIEVGETWLVRVEDRVAGTASPSTAPIRFGPIGRDGPATCIGLPYVVVIRALVG